LPAPSSPLLLEKTEENKINVYIPLIPTPSTLLRAGFSLKGEGAGTDAI